MPPESDSQEPIVLTPHREGDEIVFSADSTGESKRDRLVPKGPLDQLKRWALIGVAVGVGIAIAILFLTLFIYVVLPLFAILFLWGLIRGSLVKRY